MVEIPSLGSFAVAVVAALFSVWLLWQYLAERHSRWRLWGAAISLDAMLFALASFIQMNTESLELSIAASRARVTAVILLLQFGFLFTRARRRVPSRGWMHALTAVNAVLIAVLWATPWIVSSERGVLRGFTGLSTPYLEGILGPGGYLAFAYVAAGDAVLLGLWVNAWLLHRRSAASPDSGQRRATGRSSTVGIFLAGFGLWILLGLHDVATKVGLLDHLPYLTEYGFLGFSAAVLLIANRDLTEVRTRLASSQERLRAILHASPHAMVVLTPEGDVDYVNAAVWKLIGCDGNADLQATRRLVPQNELNRLQNRIKDSARCYEPLVFETTVDSCAGEPIALEGSGTWMGADAEHVEGFVFVLTDTRGRRRAETEMRRLAYQDPLTGLPNRTAFAEQLDQHLANSRRQGDREHWALLFLDLNDFKDINDRFGHAAGDTILTRTASRLRDSIRRTDHCYRLGGDEFLVIVTHVSEDVEVAKVASKLVQEISRPQLIGNHEMRVGVSIGITVFPHDGGDRERLLANADIAMYAAKADGAPYRFFTEEMNAAALRRMDIEHSLPRAVEHGDLQLHYHPVVDAEGGLIGVESLARWQHPTYGWVSPAEFISIAERTGAIRELGYWVIEEAMWQLRRWQDEHGIRTRVGINLSPRQFDDEGLSERIEQVLERTGLARDSIVLEITEGSVMKSPARAIAQIERLRATGLRFALDDFGAGYSAFSYLNRLPVDIIKIDRSFAARATESAGDEKTLRTLVALALDLGLRVVVEGVETAEQVRLLRSLGPVRLQGYYFARPMPGSDVPDWVRRAERVQSSRGA
jgi:diguanylate cyclase (GGDEF)-like protein/PAS domain S-box-containing protein